MLDELPVTQDKTLGLCAFCSQGRGCAPPTREHWPAQVPRGTPVAFAPKPIGARATHALMVSSPVSGGAADMATVSVMTSSGKSAQSGSGHTVPPEFAGGPARSAHHGPRPLPTLTRNNPRAVIARGKSSEVATGCESWKASGAGPPRAVAQALYGTEPLTTQLLALENDPMSHVCRLTVSYLGQLVRGSRRAGATRPTVSSQGCLMQSLRPATRHSGCAPSSLKGRSSAPPAPRARTRHFDDRLHSAAARIVATESDDWVSKFHVERRWPSLETSGPRAIH